MRFLTRFLICVFLASTGASAAYINPGVTSTASPVTLNAVIAVTGTPVQLTNSSTPLISGMNCLVISTAAKGVGIADNSSSPSNPNTVTFTGAFVGTPILNGAWWPTSVNNANAIWFNGNAGDGISCKGN